MNAEHYQASKPLIQLPFTHNPTLRCCCKQCCCCGCGGTGLGSRCGWNGGCGCGRGGGCGGSSGCRRGCSGGGCGEHRCNGGAVGGYSRHGFGSVSCSGDSFDSKGGCDGISSFGSNACKGGRRGGEYGCGNMGISGRAYSSDYKSRKPSSHEKPESKSDQINNSDFNGDGNARSTSSWSSNGYADSHSDSSDIKNMNRCDDGRCKRNHHHVANLMPGDFGIPIFGLGL
uniref:Glycine-rich cell wall structural protein 2-like n=1 Tax=Loa loa TaxID=7209 RepID=A0A1I7VQP5_LOALO